jgi:hypothetical protein
VSCATNVYGISLYECPNTVTEVARISAGQVCRVQNTGLLFCNAPMTYVCYVTNINGTLDPPTEPVYVEWHWTVEYIHPTSGRPGYYTGKFVYVATVEWLVSLHNSSGYPIPLLNQTNHTPK